MRNETAEELKQEIEAMPLFRMDPEADPEEYRTLAYLLVEKLYRYACAVNRSRYEDMGLEVVETAQKCLKSYNPEAGPFLHYFMRALKRSAVKESAIQRETQRRGGIRFPETAQLQLFQMEAVARTIGRDLEDEAVCAAAAVSLEIPEERCRELVELNRRSSVISGESREDGSDGVMTSVSDGLSLEDLFIQQEDGTNFLRRVEENFRRCRPGQQKVLAQMLTARIAAASPETVSQCRNAAFFDGDFYAACLRQGKIPTAREIAAGLGRREESVSRTLSRFLKSLHEAGNGGG